MHRIHEIHSRNLSKQVLTYRLIIGTLIYNSNIRWLEHSKNSSCDICNFKFKFKHLYAENTPNQLTLAEITGIILKRFFFSFFVVVFS